MLTTVSTMPTLGAADSDISVIGPSNVHSVTDDLGASSGCFSAVDHRPPPIGRFLFLTDSIRNTSFISASFCGIAAARSLAWLQSSFRL